MTTNSLVVLLFYSVGIKCPPSNISYNDDVVAAAAAVVLEIIDGWFWFGSIEALI